MRFLFICLLALILQARENPFVPQVKINTPSPKEELNEFKKIAFNVPSDARILNKINIVYTNVDGEIKEYPLKINETLDWHKVYMLIDAQEISNNIEEKKPIELKVEEKLEKALNKPEEEKPVESIKKEEVKPLEYYLASDFSVIIDKKTIIVKTYSKLLRQFTLKRPNRIVLDFDTKYILKNKIYNIENSYIEQIYSGVHRNFYRLVIKLDGIYDYSISKAKSEYIIKIK